MPGYFFKKKKLQNGYWYFFSGLDLMDNKELPEHPMDYVRHYCSATDTFLNGDTPVLKFWAIPITW